MRRLALVALLCSTPLAARAADVSPAGAAVLEAAFRTWAQAFVTPAYALPARPLRLTPAGDHFDAALGLLFPLGGAPAPTFTYRARLTPNADGTYALADVRTEFPKQFTLNLRAPAAGGRPARTVPTTYTLAATNQAGTGTLDPSFASPTTVVQSIDSLRMTSRGLVDQTIATGRTDSTVVIKPSADPGHLDMTLNGRIARYVLDSTPPEIGPLHAELGTVTVSMAATGVDRAGGTRLVQQVAALLARNAKPGPAARRDPATLHAMLDTLKTVAAGATFAEGAEGITIIAKDVTVTLGKVGFSLATTTGDGRLGVKLDLSMANLALPRTDLGPYTALLPSIVAIRPSVSGLPLDPLARMIERLASGGEPGLDDVTALLAVEGSHVDLDGLDVSVGGASFTGSGRLAYVSGKGYTGSTTITATGFDALVEKLQALPAAGQVMPGIILVKGMARTEGDKLVWAIANDGAKLMVNDTDVTAMLGGVMPGVAPVTPALPPAPPRGGADGNGGDPAASGGALKGAAPDAPPSANEPAPLGADGKPPPADD